jgi:AcrR family transcriptional regulator
MGDETSGPVHRAQRRPYRLQRRREAMDETRERITRAAFELHATVGPAQATISAVAERAGVQRHTVYRHFPDIVSLIRACTAHGMEVTGLPQPERWEAIGDAVARLRVALEEMYAYYRNNERMIGNILRDLPVMPELAAGSSRYQDHLGRIWGTVLASWSRLRGARGARVRALVSTALEFGTWQALTTRGGLSDVEAAATMVAAVQTAQESGPSRRA